jgi:hypothetical protein
MQHPKKENYRYFSGGQQHFLTRPCFEHRPAISEYKRGGEVANIEGGAGKPPRARRLAALTKRAIFLTLR